MQKILFIASLITLSSCVKAQSSADNPSMYYSMGKYYYDNKDFLTAYKYLLGYKFLNLAQLKKPENSSTFSNLNTAINYCEAQLRKGISESSTFNGRGWKEPNLDSINAIIKSTPPKLPANKIER